MAISTQSKAEMLCKALDYTDSPTFKRFGSVGLGHEDLNFAHLFERAAKSCNLMGVYSCQAHAGSSDSVPIVYVCEAETEDEAKKIHQSVWNQNIVPFLLVVSKGVVRIYNGFGFDPDKRDPLDTIPWDVIQEKLKALTRKSIDTGEVWYSDLWKNGPAAPSNRLDVRLLESLNTLGNELVNSSHDKIGPETAHGLIGKYIYLRYLKDRGFLADERLKEWGVDADDIFTQNAKVQAFDKLNDILQDKLNGSIFPLPKENKGKRSFKAEHLRMVAGTFHGDNPTTGQQTLFEYYDFAYIPTELLSTIYEQFLHRNDKTGKEQGAYYTPIPLVNFVLNELEEKKPLAPGMRVLDPACGSGAFLVQAYRNLIRKKLKQQQKPRLTGKELSSLLTKHIFGIDKNQDACRVAQLGLLLTLLDGLDPPSLFGSDKFHLPVLDNNIVEADTFEENSPKLQQLQDLKFDWIVGNPPWKVLGKDTASKWVNANKAERPVSNSIAEAFLWRSLDFSEKDTLIGLLMPAMTLFNLKQKQGLFRKQFFSKCDVWTIANFSNIRKILFAGADSPCAAFFFRPERTESNKSSILTYSPLRVNQAINRTENKSGVWNVIINSSEIRYVRIADAMTGDPLVWKTAMWGSHRDLNLLRKIEGRFESFVDYAKATGITAHAGPELRSKREHERKKRESGIAEPIEFVEELIGKHGISIGELRGLKHIFSFPQSTLVEIDADYAHVRKRGGLAGLVGCKPPLIVVDAYRRFAVYSDEFLLVPPRYPGIAWDNPQYLKALALYLCSDFMRYHQFFYSPQSGINRGCLSTLETLRCLPIPFGKMEDSEIKSWSGIYEGLQKNAKSKKGFSQELQARLLQEANERINKALGLRDSEKLLIHDFIRYRMEFIDGRISHDLISPCEEKHLAVYAQRLENGLDSFFDPEDGLRHKVTVLEPSNTSMVGVRIDTLDDNNKASQTFSPSVNIPKRIEELLLKQHSQWLYFQRDLRIYDKKSIFILKPNEKIQWIESQALVDANNILGEILDMKGGSR